MPGVHEHPGTRVRGYAVLIADKPERLELRAAVLEEQAERCIQQGQRLSARDFRQLAQRLRQEAAVLRRRRTDGMRFG